MIQVRGADGMRIEVDAPEVDDPQQLRRVTYDDLAGRTSGRKAELDGLDPVRVLVRRPLLEERLALGAVHVALEDDRTPGDSPDGPLGDRRVVSGQIELGVAGPREEDLLGVGDRDLAARNLQDDLPRLGHTHSVPESTAGASPRPGRRWPRR